jgi:hypothetical protein|tara:strand:- start:2220 stop:2591 length:372 start_codon:yes stop_codon:yes gene_type:complete
MFHTARASAPATTTMRSSSISTTARARRAPVRVLARAAPARMKTRTTMKLGVVARAVEGEGEREKETYARPVQEENALMESEAFSNALKGGFLAFALVCVAFLLKLSQPVIGEMIDAFPKGGR